MTIQDTAFNFLRKIVTKIRTIDFEKLKPWLTLERWKQVNPYHLISPVLFLIEPEKAHKLTLQFLGYRLLPKLKNNSDPILSTEVCGIIFPNPLGVAAGFDKNAEVISEVLNLGFGYTEIGSITPQPQPGNPTPRVFRDVLSQSVVNRFGFNSDGANVNLRRVIAWYDDNTSKSRGVIGINLGKNKDSQDAIQDYLIGLEKFAPYANYIAINISSPNTQGLRDLQQRALLEELLYKLMEKHGTLRNKPPLFVKIAPDQAPGDLENIADVALKSGIHGLIVGNTTLARPENLSPEVALEAGGLSGKPLFMPSTEILRQIYKLTEGKLPLIGCGGIFSAEDAYTKILAGASLLQLYTGLVYEGPFIAHFINRRLAAFLKRDGFKSVKEAVGKEASL